MERLGTNGTGASVGCLARSFRISRSGVVMVTQQVIEAIYNVGQAHLRWLNDQARANIGTLMGKEDFAGCFGFLEGITIPMFQRQGVYAEIFFNCKIWYLLNVQLVCKNQKKVTALFCGRPGSCADSTVYKKMGISTHPK
ncbi:hypothetical protein O181_019618 [Austropuccinia psidii MF-1]|uniref:DDE Tnp4 domain-containing protein n=1 Tax=Austropuccinia psidii MF-1 TaxID=1389203 RepID=A0A9Q3GTS1_9BASI|nr:hypothetical protein [Austropuccinia psidii MF-1]